MFTNNTADARALFAKNLRNELDRAEIETYASKGAFDLAMKISAMLAIESILVQAMPKTSPEQYKLPVSNLRKIAEMIEDYAVDFCDEGETSPVTPVAPSTLNAAPAVEVDSDGFEILTGALSGCDCWACREKRENYAKAQNVQTAVAMKKPSYEDDITIPKGIRPEVNKPVYDKPFTFPFAR